MTNSTIPSNVSHLPRDPRTLSLGGNVANLPHRPRPEGTLGTPHRKFIAKGHDAQLQDAQVNSLPTSITTMGGDCFKGRVVKRDKYTITLRYDEGKFAGQDEIFYKHAIESVRIERPTVQ